MPVRTAGPTARVLVRRGERVHTRNLKASTRLSTTSAEVPGDHLGQIAAEYGYDAATDFIAMLAAIYAACVAHVGDRGGWPFSHPGGSWAEVWEQRPAMLPSRTMMCQMEAVHGGGSQAVRILGNALLVDLFARIPTSDPRMTQGLVIAREFASGPVREQVLRSAHDAAVEVYQGAHDDQPALRYLAGTLAAATLQPRLYNGGLVIQMAHAALRASWGDGSHTVHPRPEQMYDAVDHRADAVHVALIGALAPEPFATPAFL